MNRLAICAVCAAFGLAAFAEGLPTAVNGVITIEGAVTVSDAEGAAALEAATGLILNEGAVLTYTAANDLALSAAVSGTGTFKADGSGKVTLSGDNEGLVAPGHFDFKNCYVAVAHQHGLGSTDTAAAVFFGRRRQITFDDGSNYFTNNVALDIKLSEEKYTDPAATESSGCPYIGSEASDKFFVQNADLSARNGASGFYFKNNFRMISGTFTKSGTGYLRKEGTGEIWFDEGCKVSLNGKSIIYFSNLHIGAEEFKCESLATDSTRNITMERDYTLADTLTFTPYAQNGGPTANPYYNLNGHNQNIAYLDASSTPQYGTIGSVTPCVLKTVSTKTIEKYAPVFFQGAVSFWQDCALTQTLKAKNTSTGFLKVTNGTLILDGTGGWAGMDITVGGTGTLDCRSVNSFVDGGHNLVVEDTGKLIVGADVTLQVATARFGSVTLDPQTTYSVADIQALIGGETVTIEGEGTIQTAAKSIPGTWEGWPEVGTATKVQVPDGSVAAITDADVEKVSALEEIETGTDVTIPVQTTSKTLVIKANISGGAILSASNVQPVVLTGDNSGLFSPGGFVFEESQCVVSNEHALGGAKSAPATFKYGKTMAADRLVFGCTDGVFTNRAPIKIVFSQGTPSLYLGSSSLGEFVYQAADLKVTNDGILNFYFQNNFMFIDGESTFGDTYVRSNDGTHALWGCDGDAVCHWGGQQIIYSNRIRIGGKSWAATTGLSPDAERNVTFTRDCCLGPDCVICPYANGNGGNNWFDFNGTTQEVRTIRQNAYNGANLSRLYSKDPALVKTVGTLKNAAKMGMVFAGALSYWHDSTDTNRYDYAKSTSTGDLTVSKGEVEFMGGAGWSGKNVTVKDGGSLVFSSVKSLEGGTHYLTVEPGGRLTVAADVTLKVQEAAFGSVRLEYSKVYSAGEVRALIEAAGEDVTLLGDGTIQTSAKSIPGTWEGWPEVGTATRVEIPDNTVVTLTADDLAKMLALEEIEMGQKTRIVIGDTVSETPIELTPNFIGAGKICVYGTNGNVTNVIVRGDNSTLLSPGGFLFSNTWAVVASRYGLGCEKTAAAEFYPAAPFTEGSNRSRLTFTERATTNDVALSFAMGCLCGYDSPDIEFIQTANVRGAHGSYNQDNCRAGFFNRFTVTGGEWTCPYVRVDTPSTVLTITDGCTINSLQGFYGTQGKVFLGPKEYLSNQFQFACEQSLTRVTFTKENAFKMDKGGYLNFYDQSYSEFRLDLNGYDQTMAALMGNYYWNANQQNLTITSVEPATLTLNGTTSRKVAVKCIDQASLTYAGTATQTVGCATSTSTGALTVDSGAVRFERNAKWTTGSVVLNGGELIVEPNAATNTFGTGRSSAHLFVTGDGKLNLLSDEYVSTVRTLTVDGELKDRGIYSAANCGFIKGPGSIRVMKDRPQGVLLLVR